MQRPCNVRAISPRTCSSGMLLCVKLPEEPANSRCTQYGHFSKRMVLRSTFDLGVPRGTRAAHISAPTTFWSFTRTSGATSDFLFVTGPTALPIDVFVNRSVSCSHARPPYDHRASPRHRTTARGVSRTTLSKWEAPRAAVVFNVGAPGCPQLRRGDFGGRPRDSGSSQAAMCRC